ncbi:MAG: hypothetical protein J7K40_11970, partial [candidate division Zixibacteria bacterium]|nr:hypothetical protein [candidate division Zixibacteria bacterium]
WLMDEFDAGVKEIEQSRAGARDEGMGRPATEGSTLGAFAKTIGRVPENLAAKAIMAVQGQAGASAVDKGIADKFVDWVEKRNQRLAESYEKTGDFIPGLVSKRDVAELGPNLAFSGVSMAGTLGGAAVTAPILVPGARVAGAMAGGAAAAYRMDSYQAMDSWLKKRNEENIKLFGKPISIEEENKFKKEFNELATKHGLWEAGPEAVGNVLDLALMTAKNLPGARFVPKKLVKKIAGKALKGVTGKAVKGAARVGGILATEESTEAVTQMGQQRVEAEVEGGEKRQWTSGEDWLKSAKEVLPQVIMLTGVMGAGGAAYRKATQKEGGGTGKLKQQILNSIIETYESGEQTDDQVIAAILDGHKGGLFDKNDLEELSKKFPNLKDKIEAGKKIVRAELVKEQLSS